MDIAPEKQNIDTVFSNTRYHIDFYQRDYRWDSEPTMRLLDDIFYKFNEAYEKHKNLPPSQEHVESNYSWYYLNTYVTNKANGKTFIVDGQQRLTTLSLILIKLYHMACSQNSSLKNWLDTKIAGYSGRDREFWMNHEGHKSAQQAIYDNDIEDPEIISSGITASNMVNNFKIISSRLDNNLHSLHKIESFAFYFLFRLVLIELAVDKTDVPMIFEVINDRGIRLKPYEILKGKLLGQIDKTVLEAKKYNKLWEQRLQNINNYYEDEADEFFRFYLKAKFADTRDKAQSFDGDYHRIMFSNVLDDKLSLEHNQEGVIKFLDKAFSYYTLVYEKALQNFNAEENSHLRYNFINDLEGAFLLIMSSCKEGDPEEIEKLRLIPLEVDRTFTLLQLQEAYDSNAFQAMLYSISVEIREKSLKEIRPVFNKYIMKELSRRKNLEVNTIFDYMFFKNTGNTLNPRFKRYFFARIEEFLAKNMNLKMKHSMQELVLNKGTKNGFHIEHILSYNKENFALFNNDKERFERDRNRLGGILLLKGKDNISSNNEPYSEKLKTYANTLYWNETLREDSYKSKLDMQALKKTHNLELKSIKKFDADALESRQILLFKIASIIWG